MKQKRKVKTKKVFLKRILKGIFSILNNSDVLDLFSLLLIIFSAFLLFTKYLDNLCRLIENIADFGTALAVYFCYIFDSIIFKLKGESIVPNSRIAEIPNVDLEKYLLFDISELLRKFDIFDIYIFDGYAFLEYNFFLISLIYNLSLVLLFLIPVILLVYVLIKAKPFTDSDKSVGYVSKPCRAFLSVMGQFVIPLFKWIINLGKYIYNKKVYLYSLVFIWLLNINAITLLIGFIGYYFYFSAGFKFSSIPTVFVKLLIDCILMLFSLNLFIWFFVVFGIWIYFEFKKGYKKLEHQEAMNCGYLKSLPYILLVKGEPGVGKTRWLTNAALSFQNIFKKDALDILIDIEIMFPGFSFSCLRRDLIKDIDDHLFYCIPCCDEFIERLTERDPTFYGYDFDVFPTELYNGNKIDNFVSAIKDYCKAFFIYYNDNDIISNYPIRIDGRFDGSNHFKKWNGNFFRRNKDDIKFRSRYCHILDQDIMRFGKRFDPNNLYNGSFGYGIYVNTEWGKSRGNQLTTSDVSKKDKTVNQKNDLYDHSLKMCRHANSTVRNKVFFRFLGDEQRPESLAADQRELCIIVDILSKSELTLTLPHGYLADKLYNVIVEPFRSFYVDYINKRSDTTLFILFLKSCVFGLSFGYRYLYNTFGYSEFELSSEKGSDYVNADSNKDIHVYYLHSKKDGRYNTDTHSGYFTKLQFEAELGIRDYPTYQGQRMTVDEMRMQHDYFINEWLQIMDNKPEKEIVDVVKISQIENISSEEKEDFSGFQFF